MFWSSWVLICWPQFSYFTRLDPVFFNFFEKNVWNKFCDLRRESGLDYGQYVRSRIERIKKNNPKSWNRQLISQFGSAVIGFFLEQSFTPAIFATIFRMNFLKITEVQNFFFCFSQNSTRKLFTFSARKLRKK